MPDPTPPNGDYEEIPPMNISRILGTFSCGALVLIFLAGDVRAEEYQLKAPLGIDLDALQIPEDNPLTEAKIKLGELLYFDGRLSKDGTVS